MGDSMKNKKKLIAVIVSLISIDSVSAMEVVDCGGLGSVPYVMIRFIGRIVNIIKVIVPVILIIMGMIDMAKATTASDEKQMQTSRKMFIKRIIYAVMVLFVVSIVQLLFTILQTSVFQKENNLLSCVSCVIGNDCDSEEIDLKETTATRTGSKTKKIKVTRVVIMGKKETMKEKETFIMSVKVLPVNATNINVTYKSSKTSVATVSSFGKITAKKAGTTTITVQSSSNKSAKASFKLKVTSKNNTDSSSKGSASSSSSIGGFTYYNQGEYSNVAFCDSGKNLQSSGCGAVSFSMVASNLVDNSYNPKVVANWLCSNGHGGGALSESWYTNKKLLNKFGLKSTKIAGNIGTNSDKVKKAKKQIGEKLKKGNMIILYIPGHYIVLAPGKDGKVILMDPGKRANNGTYTIDGVYNLTKNYKNRCTSSNNCGWHGVYSFSKK